MQVEVVGIAIGHIDVDLPGRAIQRMESPKSAFLIKNNDIVARYGVAGYLVRSGGVALERERTVPGKIVNLTRVLFRGPSSDDPLIIGVGGWRHGLLSARAPAAGRR